MTSRSWARSSIEITGQRLAWRESGTGPGVLYLHDAGADSLASPVFDDLAGDHRVVVLDLPGYGSSPVPTAVASAPDLAVLLAQLVRSLRLSPAAVVGTSLGGWFAAELAAAAPDVVAALVLADAAGLHAPHSYLWDLFAKGAANAAHHLVAEALLARIPAMERPEATVAGAVGAALVGPWVSNLSAAAAMSWHPAIANPALLGRLRRITAPTIVLWGESDALIPLAHGRQFAAAIPNATLKIVAGAGHLVALDRPAVLAAAVRSLTLASAGSV